MFSFWICSFIDIIESGNEDEVKLNLKVGQISVKVSDIGMTMKENVPNFRSIIDKDKIAEIFGIDPDEIRDDYPV